MTQTGGLNLLMGWLLFAALLGLLLFFLLRGGPPDRTDGTDRTNPDSAEPRDAPDPERP